MTWKVIGKRIEEDEEGRKHEIWELRNGPRKKALVSHEEGSALYYLIPNFEPVSDYTQERIIEAVAEYEREKKKKGKGEGKK